MFRGTFLLALLSAFGCSNAPLLRSSPGGRCLEERQARAVLVHLEKAADENARASNLATSATELESDQCNKLVYRRSGYRMLVFRHPTDRSAPTQGSLSSGVDVGTEGPRSRRACLADALNEIQRLGLPFSRTLIARHQKRHAWVWADPEIGPAKWLHCEGRPSPAWFTSLDTFLHELNHENHSPRCLYDPVNGTERCFDLSSRLPLRGIAALPEFATRDAQAAEGLEFVQKFYLTDNDQPPIMLLEELNSYIITARTMSAVLKTRGTSAVFSPAQAGSAMGESRGAVLLPLFLLYTVRYLDQVRGSDPDLFEDNFGRRHRNRAPLLELLGDGERAFLEWQQRLASARRPARDFETGFWEQYLELKTRVFR